MNIRDSIAGHGLRQQLAPGVIDDPEQRAADIAKYAKFEDSGLRRSADPDSLMSDALAEDLANELPKATLLAGKRAALERTIASTRAEMLKQQQIAASALDKFRQLKVSLRVDEDALDGLLVSEV